MLNIDYTKTELDLSNAIISPDCKLQSLKLIDDYIYVGEKGVKGIAESLMSPECKLQILNLCFNHIGDKGAKEIAKALMSPECKLQELDLSLNDIGDEGAKEIARALISQTSSCKLQELNLSLNHIREKGAKEITRALISPECKLQKLNLNGNCIKKETLDLTHKLVENNKRRIEHEKEIQKIFPLVLCGMKYDENSNLKMLNKDVMCEIYNILINDF